MLKWSIEELDLELKYSWNISRGSLTQKKNYIVVLKDDENNIGRGEIAISERYEETPLKIKNGFKIFKEMRPEKIDGIEDLREILEQIEIPRSLSFAIESAFIHYLAQISETTVPEILGIKSQNGVKISYSIPILESIDQLSTFVEENNLKRFQALKLKIDKNHSTEYVRTLSHYYSGRIRIDANESFENATETLDFIRSIEDLLPRIDFIEQPMPAKNHQEYLFLYKHTMVPIFADESVIDGDISSFHSDRFHGVNIKLMKSGSYFKALKQIKAAKNLGLKVMIGCMIESSLGISSAMNLASLADYLDLDSFIFLKKDPFQILEEEGGKIFFSHYH